MSPLDPAALFPPLTPGAMPQSKSTSVFHALGSYADRIKHEQQSNGKSGSNSGASSTLPSPAPSRTGHEDDDGSWETVSTVRNKKRPDRVERNAERPERQEDKGRSNSRNWRERGGDDKSSTSTAAADKDKDAAGGKKEASSTASSSKAATPRASAAPTPTKSAWTATGPASPPAPSSETVEDAPVPADKADKSTEPATNGNSAKSTNGNGGKRGHSHKPSVDKVLTKADEEDNWRRKEPVATPAPPPAPAVPAKAAPPPSVNAWALRKKHGHGSSASGSKGPTPAQAASNKAAARTAAAVAEASTAAAASQPAESKDTHKPSGKKQKKKGADAHSGDATAWPEVSHVHETKSEDKKGRHSKQASDSTIDDGPSAQGGKKQKWTKMSASELQEAADKVAAETSRRQAKQKQRLREGGDEPMKKGVNKQRAQEKLAAQRPPRTQRSGSHGSTSLPPHTIANGRLAPTSNASEASDAANGDLHPGTNGSASVPLSRHGSNQGTPKRPSPHSGSTPLSPESGGTALPHHFGPRRGRDRDGRGGYGGRGGRGGYRSASNTPMNRMYELSPVGTNANLYNAGYGMGYGYYPVPANMAAMVAVPGYDVTAAQYALYQRNMPPPPLPVTAVPNIDPLRYWVLGQVEYYFSIQNLVMDFFLRQQMDAEGWIEIAMIASFNRIKTLTADVAVVREVMGLSSLLELEADKVRLGSGEWRRWVLPDAQPVNAPGALSPSPKKSGETEVSHGIPPNVNFTDDGDGSALGIEDMQLPMSPVPKFDVENALLRQGGSAAQSSTASVLASDEGKMSMTPATSVAENESEAGDK